MNDDLDLDREPPRAAHRPNRSQWVLAGFIVVLGVFSISLRTIYELGYEQVSVLFVALPTFLGVALALAPRAGTAVGMALRGVTLALMISAIVFMEGFVCVLMAAPLFYGFAILAAVLVDVIRSSTGGPRSFAIGVLSLLVVSGAEGVHPDFSFDRDEVVQVTRIVNADAAAVERALAEVPQFEAPLPTFLRAGFPRPVATEGAGLSVGDERRIHFAGGEGHPGDLVLRGGERAPGRVRFDLVKDDSHLAHWLDWDSSEVSWVAVDGGTRVTWTVRFTRRLDPAWYFAPSQRHAMTLAAGYLIETVATP